jgi:hypothetical protein
MSSNFFDSDAHLTNPLYCESVALSCGAGNVIVSHWFDELVGLLQSEPGEQQIGAPPAALQQR